jgi:hypothetical protein
VEKQQKLAEILRPALPALAEEVIQSVAREVDVYARPIEGRFGQNLRVGVAAALERFVDLLAQPESDDPSARQVYIDLGRGEFREGRGLDALLAAYRVGARVAWRRTVDLGVEAGVETTSLFTLGEAIFDYIDGLSALSVEGYTSAQSAAAGERQRMRETLIRMLLQEPQPDAAAVRAAAEAAGWRLPRTLAALVTSAEGAESLPSRLAGDVVMAVADGRATVLVADPAAPARRQALESAVGDAPAALGPVTPWRQAGKSHRRAELAWTYARRTGLHGLVNADDHMESLVFENDPELAADLASGALAPLSALGDKARERLRTTLAAWLERQGRVEEVARALSVHPQTVRYRLAQLRDVFGDRLDDPDGRFELQLALRAAATAGPATSSSA